MYGGVNIASGPDNVWRVGFTYEKNKKMGRDNVCWGEAQRKMKMLTRENKAKEVVIFKRSWVLVQGKKYGAPGEDLSICSLDCDWFTIRRQKNVDRKWSKVGDCRNGGCGDDKK